jgi:ABC-type enterochelin transport system permease subunit
MEYILRLNQLPQFLTTLYQQDIESGQEQLILLVVVGVVTGRDGSR